MKKKKRIILIIVIVVVLVLVFCLLFLGKKKSEDIMFRTEPSKIDSVEITVTATGELQPVYQVEVGTQVSGIVQKLYVDFNSEVQKGDLLAELDRSTLLEQVNQAQATLSNAESNLTLAQQNYDRIKALFDNKAATQASYEEALNKLIQAKNQVLTSKSDLSRANVNLSYAKIYSPISGIVLNKEVEEGQTVASSFSTPTLFTIANDLTQMQVEADVDEADIGQIRVGQLVTFTVDAFPNDVFTGCVKQIRLEPVVSSNVVTYTVIIEAPNKDEKLFPGMTASVTIIVDNEKGISIPVEALYYSMKASSQESLKKQGLSVKSLFSNEEELISSLKDVNNKTIWIKNENTYEQRQISVGIDDGARVIVTKGLKEGENVVLSESFMMIKPNSKEESGVSFMPGPPERNKR